MDPLQLGLLYGAATLAVLFSGMPIAFALGGVAVVFMLAFMPAASLDTVTQNVYEEMANITLLTIPLFILKGAAIGRSRAGADLYSALHAWLHRVPGGLGVANVLACALFAAMAGSSPATCSAIGSRMITAEPDITRLLARLKGLKLILQRRDRHDRRVVWTQISAAGLELLREMDPVIQRIPGELLGHLSGAELAELIRLLELARTGSGEQSA